MKLPHQVTIGTTNFCLHRMDPFTEVRHLEFKLLKVLAPVLGAGGSLLSGLDLSKLDTKASMEETSKFIIKSFLSSKLDLGQLAMGIQDALGALPDSEFSALIRGMFKKVQWLKDDGADPEFLVNDNLINQAFEDTTGIYILMWEVARYNKFLPFGRLPIGTRN